MQIEPNTVHITLKPGDKIVLNVGITHKCDIVVTKNGSLHITHRDQEFDI